ncbi:hypothetical protein ABKN59_004701 [Abortiporus biennis]
MFSNSQYNSTQSQNPDPNRMSNQGTSHSPSIRPGSLSASTSLNVGGSLGMGDSLQQSRGTYQPGYLMSATQGNQSNQGNQRYEDAPIVQTKAKMHSILSGAGASDFGMGSMFESTRERQRQTLADEDAPPTNSVHDIVNEVYPDTASSRRQQIAAFDASARASMFKPPQPQAPSTPVTSSAAKPLYVIVFGYPSDKFTATAEYFSSLGQTTEPEQNTELLNCFRIGYINPADALRAIRKNGDVVGGSWMIGVKWADPTQAEILLGAALVRGGSFTYGQSEPLTGPDVTMSSSPPSSRGFVSPDTSSLAINANHARNSAASTPSVGTPIKLAPSASAFRKPGGSSTTVTPKRPGEGPMFVTGGLPGQPSGIQQSPSKGVLGQVSDLIFGW